MQVLRENQLRLLESLSSCSSTGQAVSILCVGQDDSSRPALARFDLSLEICPSYAIERTHALGRVKSEVPSGLASVASRILHQSFRSVRGAPLQEIAKHSLFNHSVKLQRFCAASSPPIQGVAFFAIVFDERLLFVILGGAAGTREKHY